MDELLTATEKYLFALAGSLYTTMAEDVVGHGDTRDADLAELAAAIHVIQRMIGNQAMARKYPALARTLGNAMGQDPASG
jgi:hypothetical protein